MGPPAQTLYQMRSKGYIKGGTVGTTIIAEPDDWYEPAQVRFLNDEPARHSIQQLVVRSSAGLQDLAGPQEV